MTARPQRKNARNLLLGGLATGWWVGTQLERGIIDRSASITGLYVESFIQPHLESLDTGSWLTATDKASRSPAAPSPAVSLACCIPLVQPTNGLTKT